MYGKVFFIAIAFVLGVAAEGYYCPYEELGATDGQNLLYDYYSGDSNRGYWERLGQTG